MKMQDENGKSCITIKYMFSYFCDLAVLACDNYLFLKHYPYLWNSL